MITIVIVDDDRADLDALHDALAARYGAGAAVHAFASAREALGRFEDGLWADAALLDILMPDMTGMELARALRRLGFAGPIVFLTSSNHFAAEAFEVRAYSYLLKPIDSARLGAVLDGMEEDLRGREEGALTLTTRQMTRRVPFGDLVVVEVRAGRLLFTLRDGETVVVSGAMKRYAPLLLADARFAKCHGSFVVNMDCVRTLTGNEVILQNGMRAPLAKRYTDFKRQYIAYCVGGQVSE